jgi:hypothetical protein
MSADRSREHENGLIIEWLTMASLSPMCFEQLGQDEIKNLLNRTLAACRIGELKDINMVSIVNAVDSTFDMKSISADKHKLISNFVCLLIQLPQLAPIHRETLMKRIFYGNEGRLTMLLLSIHKRMTTQLSKLASCDAKENAASSIMQILVLRLL